MRSIIVAFPDMTNAHKIRDILAMHDFPVRGLATNGSMALRFISSEDGGGLIVCGPNFPDMTAIQLSSLMPDDYDMLVLSSSGAMNMGYEHKEGLYTLTLPLHTQDLVASVRMLLETRQMYRNTMRAVKPPVPQASPKGPQTPPKRSPEEQRVIDRAKVLLMNRNNMSEQEAHRFLQKRCMDTGTKLYDMALAVLKSQEL